MHACVIQVLSGGSQLASLIAEACTVFLLGPVLTVTILWAKGKLRPFARIEVHLRGSLRASGHGSDAKDDDEQRIRPNPLLTLV